MNRDLEKAWHRLKGNPLQLIFLLCSYWRIGLENFSVSFSRLRSCTEYSQFTQNHSCSSFIFAFNMRLFCGTLRPRKVCGTPAWRRIIILKFYELNLQRVASCSCTWPGLGASVLCAFQFGQRHTHTLSLGPFATKVVGISHIDINFENWPNSGLAAGIENGTTDQRRRRQVKQGGAAVRMPPILAN